MKLWRNTIAEKLVMKRGKNTFKTETKEEKKATLQCLTLHMDYHTGNTA